MLHALSPSRRFWIALAAVCLINVTGWFIVFHAMKPELKLLRIERFNPGDEAVIAPRQGLQWQFNLPVDQSRPPGELFQITPAVAGAWEWRDARTVVFVPEADLPPATRFTFVAAADRVSTPEGLKLADDYRVSVMTSPLRVVSVHPSRHYEHDRFVLELRFSDEVVADHFHRALTLHLPDGRPVQFQAMGQVNSGSVLRVLTDSLPPGQGGQRVLGLKVAAGLAGVGGPLGLTEPFATTITLENRPVLTSAEASAERGEKAEIYLRGNTEFRVEDLRKVIRVEPAVPFVVQGGYQGVRLVGDFVCGQRYTVHVGAPAAGEDAGRYPLPTQLSAFIPSRPPGVWFAHESGYLSSRGHRAVLAHAVNLREVKLRALRVYDQNIVHWLNGEGRRSLRYNTEAHARPLAEKTLALTGRKDTREDVRIELDALLGAEAPGNGVLLLELACARPEQYQGEEYSWRYWDRAISLVTLSDIGLTAKSGAGEVVAWAVSLRDGKPLAGVRVRAYSSKSQWLGTAVTDEQGIARISDVYPAAGETVSVLLADMGGAPAGQVGNPLDPSVQASAELTWLRLRDGRWERDGLDTGGDAYQRKGFDAYLFSERGVYRPGETIHFSAIVRDAEGGAGRAFPAQLLMQRPDRRNWKTLNVMVDADGSVRQAVELPEALPTGLWTASLKISGEEQPITTRSFLVEHYMPDRLKLAMRLGAGSPRLTLDGEQAAGIGVQGDYLFGRPASGLEVSAEARLDPSVFAPQGFAGYRFDDRAAGHEPAVIGAVGMAADRVTLGAAGAGELRPDLSALKSASFRGPWRLSAVATLHEAGGRGVSAAGTVELDLVPAYLGIRVPGNPAVDEPAAFEVALVQPDGRVLPDGRSVTLRLLREQWTWNYVYRDGRYHYNSRRTFDEQKSWQADLSEGRLASSVAPPNAGAYVLVVEDGQGLRAAAAFHVRSANGWETTSGGQDPERLEVLLFDGERALGQEPIAIDARPRVLVKSPFAGTLLLTVETDRVIETHTVKMDNAQCELELSPSARWAPNAYITATVVRGIDPDAPWRSHRAFGVQRVRLDPAWRRAGVSIAAEDIAQPRAAHAVQITLTDPQGKPLADAPVTLMAVDEGILRLTRFASPDPLAHYFRLRALAVDSADLYSMLMPEAPKPPSTVGGDGGEEPELDESRHGSPVAARRVAPLSVVLGTLRTDSQGVVRAEVPLPEFLGQVRLMAVAHKGELMGSGEAFVQVKSDLALQASAPRFAAPGDEFEATVVLFNNSGAPAVVELVGELKAREADSAAPLQFASTAGPRVVRGGIALAAGEQRTERFMVKALPVAGAAVVSFRISDEAGRSFGESFELPVRPPNPLITLADMHRVEPATPLRVRFPAAMLGGTEKAEIRISAFPQLQIPAGLEYLDRYPHGCAEQTLSGAFPLVFLQDIGPSISPHLFLRENLAPKIEHAVLRLVGMQNGDGGIGMWSGGESWPWTSVYAAHFFVEAEQAGFAAPADFRQRLTRYVLRLLDRTTDDAALLEAQCYAAYVMALDGRPQHATMARLESTLTQSASSASPHARLWLACAQLAGGRRDLAAKLLPRTPPLPRDERQLAGNLVSPVRDRAIILSAYLQLDAKNPAIPALAQQIADEGLRRQWRSTQDVSFAVMALGRYLRTVKPQRPYDSVEAFVGDQSLGKAGRGEALNLVLDLAQARELRIEAQGGEAFVTQLHHGVPLSPAASSESGMALSRRYVGPSEGGVVRIGNTVTVELTISAPAALSNVVVEDLLPAGFEIENTRLVGTSSQAGPERPQPLRLEARDDRLLAYGHLPAGTTVVRYVARAVNAGVFVAPAARCEVMYDIATHATLAGGQVLRVVRDDAMVADIER